MGPMPSSSQRAGDAPVSLSLLFFFFHLINSESKVTLSTQCYQLVLERPFCLGLSAVRSLLSSWEKLIFLLYSLYYNRYFLCICFCQLAYFFLFAFIFSLELLLKWQYGLGFLTFGNIRTGYNSIHLILLLYLYN